MSLLTANQTLQRKYSVSLLITLLLALGFQSMAWAQSAISIVDIAPPANDVSEQSPPAPERVALFAWEGVAGTTYTVRFSIPLNPSLVVGVGATIISTSFESTKGTLTVVAQYAGEKIIADQNIELPANSFLIAIDPGVAGAVLPFSNTKKITKSSVNIKATSASPCYGPGAKPALYQDTSGDFGDDDGLNDPAEPNDNAATVGLPVEAPGSFASTNAFYWCVVPPSGNLQATGLRLVGEANASARLSLTISPSLIAFMANRLSRTLTAGNLGIFSDELQVGNNVTNSAAGASIAITLPIDSNSTKISSGTTATQTRARATHGKPRTARATASGKLEARTITLGVKEALTLSADSFQIIGNKVVFSGFVDDLSLVGLSVEIIRLGGNTKCGIEIDAVKGTVIARGKIQSDGSFNVQIPTSAVFNQDKKKSTLIARIPGQATKSSREISLANKSRNLRQ